MLESFVRAVEETFARMLECTAHPIDVTETPPTDRPRPKDISAVMGFTGGYQGMIILSFPTDVANRVVERCTGEVAVSDAEVVDAVSEFLNNISGCAKRTLKAAGEAIEMSLPTVVIGRDHEIFSSSSRPCVRIDFESELGEFYIQMSLQRANTPDRIVIIDDSRLSRRIMRNALTNLTRDVEFIECSDGPAALKYLEELSFKVSLIILDVKMPNISGLDLLKSLRMISDGRRVPVLIVTSDQTAERRLRELETQLPAGLGRTSLVFKPFTGELVRDQAAALLAPEPKRRSTPN